MICCSPPLAPGSAGKQAGFRMQHYESIGALGPSALIHLLHYDACLRGPARSLHVCSIILFSIIMTDSTVVRYCENLDLASIDTPQTAFTTAIGRNTADRCATIEAVHMSLCKDCNQDPLAMGGDLRLLRVCQD